MLGMAQSKCIYHWLFWKRDFCTVSASAAEGLCRTPFPGEGHWLDKDAQEGCAVPLPVQVLIAVQALPVAGDFLCKEIPEEAAAESFSYGICGLWSAARRDQSSKISKDLLPGGAGPLGEDHQKCASSS